METEVMKRSKLDHPDWVVSYPKAFLAFPHENYAEFIDRTLVHKRPAERAYETTFLAGVFGGRCWFEASRPFTQLAWYPQVED